MTPRTNETQRAHLLSLLITGRSDAGPFSFATDETLRFARGLDPELAGEIVSSVLAAYAPGADHALAERAAHVAHELGLGDAVPALVGCIERLPPGDRVASVACAALEILDGASIGPLVEAFGRAASREVRFALGLALTMLPRDNGEIRATFERHLAADPELAAHLLGVLGDRRAVPALRATLAQLDLPPPGVTVPESFETIASLGEAILALGGRMTKPERAKLDEACARADALAAGGRREADPGLH